MITLVYKMKKSIDVQIRRLTSYSLFIQKCHITQKKMKKLIIKSNLKAIIETQVDGAGYQEYKLCIVTYMALASYEDKAQ